MYYVYWIQSEDKKNYIGYTSNLENRLAAHNSGSNKSTRGKQWRIVYYEAFLSEKDARTREQKLKHNGHARYGLNSRIHNSLEQFDGGGSSDPKPW